MQNNSTGGGEGQTGERVGRKGGKHGKGRQREGGLLRVASSERRAWEGGGGGGAGCARSILVCRHAVRQVRQTTRQIETDDDDLKIGYRTP